MFFEELCVLGLLSAMAFILGMICAVGWIITAELRKEDKKAMRRMSYDNAILRDRIRKMEALKNIDVANEFNSYLDREGGNK